MIIVKQNHHVIYFRKGAFGIEAADKIFNPAYSNDLKALKEPSIYELNCFTSVKTYRILYEPSYCFYNVKSIQKRLGYISPGEYFGSLKAETSERSKQVA
jgi:hypothetical protein